MIIGNPIMAGGGGVTASISVTGLSETDTVTATNGSKTLAGKWTQIPNPASVVPSGYTQLEYTESTGTQVIYTGWLPSTNSNFDLSVELTGFFGSDKDYFMGNDDGGGFLFGTKDGSSQPMCLWSRSKGYQNIGSANIQAGKLYTLQYNFSTGVVTLNGDNYNLSAVEFGTSQVKLFAGNNANGFYFAKAKIYSCKFWTNGDLERHFIPAKRNSDSEIGLYDIVNGVFYTNAGTGEFVAGPEIPQTIDGFLIEPIRDFGTWTVTATDGAKTATQDVLVDVITEYEIEMSLPA